MRRRQIRAAAKKVFSEKGFSGATIENIAEEAELSPATIYLYFRNKDELSASLNVEMLNLLISKVKDVRGREELGPEAMIRALAEALYEVYESDPSNLINVLEFQSRGSLRNLSPQLLEDIRSLSGRALRLIAEIFETGVEEGVFLDCKPIAFADVVWGLFVGLVLLEGGKKSFDDRKDYLRNTLGLALKIISRGIRPMGDEEAPLDDCGGARRKPGERAAPVSS